MKKYLTSSKGFTLIELLVVVSVVGVISTTVVSSLSEARNRSEDAGRFAEIKAIQNALEMYYLDNGAYPDRTSGTVSYWVSTCPNNNYGGNWSLLTSQLAPYIDLPQQAVGSTDTGYSGLGLCYSYVVQSTTGCPRVSNSSIQSYTLYWGSENETEYMFSSTYWDQYQANGVSPHYMNSICSPK